MGGVEGSNLGTDAGRLIVAKIKIHFKIAKNFIGTIIGRK
jgi:hypothetical protein